MENSCNNCINFYIDKEYKNETEIQNFNCGKYTSFNNYLKEKKYKEYKEDAKAVIHYVIDAENEALIGYFSLAASAVFVGDKLAATIIPAIELKMFAIDEKYQGKGLSGKILGSMYDIVKYYAMNYVGAKMLVLYAIPETEDPIVVKMYKKSGFAEMELDSSMYRFKDDFNNQCVPMYKLIEL